MRAMETAVICLTECDEICGGRIPILKHDEDDPDWHGWDKYNGNPQDELPIFPTTALDERFYGDLQGLNKTETTKAFGVEQVDEWRRSYAVRPPGGESLEDTRKRVLPFFKQRIMCHVKQGDHVLVSAHGNSLRSILMELDELSPEEVPKLELDTGVPIVYDFNEMGQISQKTVLTK